MGWSVKLGKILGIDIKVHVTFALVLIWGAFNFGGSAGPLYGILVTIALFVLVLLHELGHSVAAMNYGIPVKDITLLPIGGLARLERMPKKPLQELVVALAGPLVNVILAIILFPIITFLFLSQPELFSLHTMTEPGLLGLLSFLLSANLVLAIFNMIPAFPMDGGRVLRAILGFFTTYHQATQIAVRVGRLFAIGLGIFAILNMQFFLAFIALFIFMAGSQEGKAVAVHNLLSRIQVGQILGSNNNVALSPHSTIGQVAPMVMSNPQSNFAVMDADSGQLLGVANGKKVAQAMSQGEWYRRVTEIMQPPKQIPTVALTTTLDEVQSKLDETSQKVAVVYDGLSFRGLISLDDIYRAFHFVSKNQSAERVTVSG